MLERDQESAASMHLAVEGSSLCPSQYTYNLMVMHASFDLASRACSEWFDGCLNERVNVD